MTQIKHNEHNLTWAATFVLVSFIFMVLVLPGVYTDSIPNEKNTGGAIAIALAALLHLILFIGCILIIRKIKRDGGKRKNKDYLWIIVILLVIQGLLYSDGAHALKNNEPTYLSVFMYISILADSIAITLILYTLYLNRK